MKNLELSFKICIFGDPSVGKTSLTKRFTTDQFDEYLKATMGAVINVKFLDIENKRVSLQILDFAGEDRFKFLLPIYASGSLGAIFMYDITRKTSLDNIDDWLSVFREGIDEHNNIPILMVGGKSDLEENRAISIEDAANIAKSIGTFDTLECSSKTGENIELIFDTLVKEMIKRNNT